MTKETISELEGRRGRAAEASEEAKGALSKLEEQRASLAVFAFEGDEDARSRLRELDHEISSQRVKLNTASLAAEELGRQLEAEEARLEAERLAAEAKHRADLPYS